MKSVTIREENSLNSLNESRSLKSRLCVCERERDTVTQSKVSLQWLQRRAKGEFIPFPVSFIIVFDTNEDRNILLHQPHL